MMTTPPSTSTVGTSWVTKGTMTVPAGVLTSSRSCAGGTFLEGGQDAVLVDAHASHGQGGAAARDLQGCPGGQHLRIVAANVENDLAAQAVSGADDSGCELHGFSSP